MKVEGPGLIRHWAGDRGLELNYVHLHEGHSLPELAPTDALVIMGGPMGVGDRCSLAWLDAEIEWVGRHIRSGGRAFGVCLGGQIIAAALGAEVTRNAFKEIGWMPVSFAPGAVSHGAFEGLPPELTVLHWHGDTFALPLNAVRAASSEACRNQAFSLDGRVVALQFHLEAEPALVADFVSDFDPELREGGRYVQSAEAIRAGTALYLPRCRQVLYTLLDRWAGIASVTSQPGSEAAAV